MIITEPRVELLAYTQLPPEYIYKTNRPDAPINLSPANLMQAKLVQADPCSELARVVERCGRVSWKSEDKIGEGTADGFCTRVVNIRKDESIAEHCSVTLLFVTDRYMTHQLVRHRIGSYTQESTHYINYSKKGDQIEVCRPMGIPRFLVSPPNRETEEYGSWVAGCEEAERRYFTLLAKGVKHYHARYVLPSCLKTEIAVTFNLRIWRYVLGLRATPNNTPEIVHVMKMAGKILAGLCPEMFKEWE